MNVLVTAGNTLAFVDRVRCLTNVFTGRTGTQVALEAHARGHRVTLLTSHPEVVADLHGTPPEHDFTIRPYRAFDELADRMENTIRTGSLDTIVHTAAVSDYLCAGVYAPEAGAQFDPAARRWTGEPAFADASAAKVKSDSPELWLRLVRAPKLVDRVRSPWNFAGVLVKFKLEVGIDETALLEIAERSRRHSDADLMVANTLDGANQWALLGPLDGRYERIARRELAPRLLDALELLHRERSRG
jgi:phosphopantothenoylcysteine synthetase/decarboxylase